MSKAKDEMRVIEKFLWLPKNLPVKNKMVIHKSKTIFLGTALISQRKELVKNIFGVYSWKWVDIFFEEGEHNASM